MVVVGSGVVVELDGGVDGGVLDGVSLRVGVADDVDGAVLPGCCGGAGTVITVVPPVGSTSVVVVWDGGAGAVVVEEPLVGVGAG